MPTADQRALVENAAAFGITQADIAEQLKIDEKTLRKHFRDELSGGKFKVDMIAGKTVTELMRAHPIGGGKILHLSPQIALTSLTSIGPPSLPTCSLTLVSFQPMRREV